MGDLLVRPSGVVNLIVISLAIAIAGAGIGAGVPRLIDDELRLTVYGIDTSPSINVLGRLAQIIGGICGLMSRCARSGYGVCSESLPRPSNLLYSPFSYVFGGAPYWRA
jgi:hypothetical protein